MPQINKTIPDDLHYALKLYALKNRVTMQEALIRAIELLTKENTND